MECVAVSDVLRSTIVLLLHRRDGKKFQEGDHNFAIRSGKLTCENFHKVRGNKIAPSRGKFLLLTLMGLLIGLGGLVWWSWPYKSEIT